MFTFLKKVFGFDNKTMADAGVRIEQAPYKVDTVVIEPVAAPAPAPAVAPAPTPAPAKKKRYYAKKAPSTTKKATPKKEVAQNTQAKQPGRKPKAK